MVIVGFVAVGFFKGSDGSVKPWRFISDFSCAALSSLHGGD